VLLFVSDGVADENLSGKRVISPIDATAICLDDLGRYSARGFRLGVL
jgi:hypothetical protein